MELVHQIHDETNFDSGASRYQNELGKETTFPS